jgi:outer membrane protein OmpA-like peptidoglycan-associated protein
MFRTFVVAVPVAVLVAGGTTACATKGFVRNSVGEVNTKVDSLGRSLEETQERTRQNEGRINEVDQKVAAAAKEASSASGAAAAANTAATNAGSRADAVNTRVDVMDKAARRMVYEVVLSEDNGNFKFAATELPDEAKSKIDQMITQLKSDPKAVFFEIEGHTDNTGSQLTNERLGMERAEAVKRYLYEQHQIPLHKMNVISYGEEKPVSPNNTRDGRAQNRRVVIKVLA